MAVSSPPPMPKPRRMPASRPYVLLAAAAALGGLAATAAVADPPATGYYRIDSQMVMPHLEEMRRISKREDRCIAAAEVEALFPVMRQPSFNGCVLVPTDVSEVTHRYVLRCETALVATGDARVDFAPQGASGVLNVKMGGKNMTFSQSVDARRLGACDTAAPRTP